MRGLANFGRGLATKPKNKATAGQAWHKNRKRGAAVAAGAGMRAGFRNVWRHLGGWFRRRVLGRKPPKKVTKKAKSTTKKVGATVGRGPNQKTGTNPAATPKAAPGDPIRPGTNDPAKENTMASQDMPSGTRELAGRMWATADAWTPRGMLTAVEEYHDLPFTLGFVRSAVGALMEKSMKRFPVDQTIAQQLGRIVECLDTATNMAAKVPEAVEAIHKKELDRLRNPRAGEAMWDLSANGRG